MLRWHLQYEMIQELALTAAAPVMSHELLSQHNMEPLPFPIPKPSATANHGATKGALPPAMERRETKRRPEKHTPGQWMEKATEAGAVLQQSALYTQESGTTRCESKIYLAPQPCRETRSPQRSSLPVGWEGIQEEWGQPLADTTISYKLPITPLHKEFAALVLLEQIP